MEREQYTQWDNEHKVLNFCCYRYKIDDDHGEQLSWFRKNWQMLVGLIVFVAMALMLGVAFADAICNFLDRL